MKRKTKRKLKHTGGYVKPTEVKVGDTLSESIIPRTIKVIYDKFPVNKHTQFKYKGYIFKFDNNLNPVPVEVPSHIADILLQIVNKGCRCHESGELKKLFHEVK